MNDYDIVLKLDVVGQIVLFVESGELLGAGDSFLRGRDRRSIDDGFILYFQLFFHAAQEVIGPSMVVLQLFADHVDAHRCLDHGVASFS